MSASENEFDEADIAEHKNALKRLEKSDPDFYNFLQAEEARLLDFNLADEADSSDDDAPRHKPPKPEQLEVS